MVQGLREEMYTVLALLLMGPKFHKMGSWTEISHFHFVFIMASQVILAVYTCMYVYTVYVLVTCSIILLLLQVICTGAKGLCMGYNIYENTEPVVKFTKL